MTQTLDLSAQNMEAYVALFGMNDQHITLIEQECNVTIALRGSSLIISGEEPDVQVASESIRLLLNMIHRGEIVDRVRIRYVLSMAREGNADVMNEGLKSIIAVTHRGKQIQCKTLGQIQYVDTIRRHDLTFAIGPAGTGKTYLAMALAVVALAV